MPTCVDETAVYLSIQRNLLICIGLYQKSNKSFKNVKNYCRLELWREC